MGDFTYSQLLDMSGNVRVDQVRRSDGANVLTGMMQFGDELQPIPDFSDPDGLAYQAWLAAGNTPSAPGAVVQKTFSQRDFLALWTSDELTKLFTARQSKSTVDQFVTYAMAGTVDTTDPVISGGMNDRVSDGVLTAARAKAILAGQAPTS